MNCYANKKVQRFFNGINVQNRTLKSILRLVGKTLKNAEYYIKFYSMIYIKHINFDQSTLVIVIYSFLTDRFRNRVHFPGI